MIIGLVGFIGSGKGTVGDILRDKYGYVQDSFAAPLKDAVAAIFGWDRELLEGSTTASRAWREVPDPFWSEKFGKPFTPRLALQLMGTEAGRDVFHKDVWVTSLIHRNIGKDVVITDVRFKNEINTVRQNGGCIIWVRRGENPYWYTTALHANNPGWNGPEKSDLALKEMKELGIHISEWEWIGTDVNYIIQNDGTLEDLKTAVGIAMQCLTTNKQIGS